MGLSDLLSSRRAGTVSALTLVVEAAISLYRGEKRLAAMLLGAAALSYRWSFLGAIAEALIRVYKRYR